MVLLDTRRVFAHGDPHPSNPDQLRTIHSQSGDRPSSRRRAPDDFGVVVIPGEVILPTITIGMEQSNLLLGVGIDCRRSFRLVSVASSSFDRQPIVKLGLGSNETLSAIAKQGNLGNICANIIDDRDDRQ